MGDSAEKITCCLYLVALVITHSTVCPLFHKSAAHANQTCMQA